MGSLEGGKSLGDTRDSSMPWNPWKSRFFPRSIEGGRVTVPRPVNVAGRGSDQLNPKIRPAIFDEMENTVIVARKIRETMTRKTPSGGRYNARRNFVSGIHSSNGTSMDFICEPAFRDYFANSILEFNSLNRLFP